MNFLVIGMFAFFERGGEREKECYEDVVRDTKLGLEPHNHHVIGLTIMTQERPEHRVIRLLMITARSPMMMGRRVGDDPECRVLRAMSTFPARRKIYSVALRVVLSMQIHWQPSN